jgi:CHAT domain-containing protein
VLRDDEVLLEYLVTGDRLLSFAVTQRGAVAFERSILEDDLVRRVRIARDLMAEPDGDPAIRDKVLGTLYGILLEQPLASDLAANARRIIVVPHGVLTYLPFAALRAPVSGRYVVQDYALQVLPSAAALPAIRDAQRSASSGTIGGIAFAPLDKALPATLEEALAFRRTWLGARVERGERVTESRLRGALEEAQIVHVATHGIMNARHPMFSRIVLAGGEAVSSNDGRLEVHELLGLRVASPLVFLSGCETGLGPSWSTGFARGEDYATLAQAFLYAGAANVIATLWPVEDRGAAVFAKGFYETLAKSDPVDALAQAQRSMLLHPRYGAPYYWAPYQVLGEGLGKLSAQESGARVVPSG